MHRMVGTFTLTAGIAVVGDYSVYAEQGADLEAVKAVNEAFYEAASARDLARMDAVWAHEPYVRVIHPTSRQVEAGWEAVRASWQNLFEEFIEISVTMPEPHLRVGETVGWVTGEEHFQGRGSTGEEVSVTLLATSVFEKPGDRWLMVHHHVSVPPPQQ